MIDRDRLLTLLSQLDVTRDEEIDCDEFLAEVGGYLERFHPEQTPPEQYDALHHHLRVCPECLEEFRALLELHRREPESGDGTST